MCHIWSVKDLLSLGSCCMAMQAICSRAETKAACLIKQSPDEAVFLALDQTGKYCTGVEVLRILFIVHNADVADVKQLFRHRYHSEVHALHV